MATTLLVLALSSAGTTEPEPYKELPHAQPQRADHHQPQAPRDLPPKSGPHDPYDVDDPTIGNLDADLLEAVQAAASDARDDGVPMSVTSGWRSREQQQRLFDEAVDEYGSEEEALRWVSTPDTSAHVTGGAVDLGPTDAMSWLSQHGSDYGLCQTFANEAWHYELATTPGGECPEMLPDGSSRS
ncbi:D-alanyl-D-alanine carboxypeptidase [Nocardioides szechwanensis]|uniref:D-alanyl-D-alanine carboxypeptidase n=1 Tax=Nocardioides szechwanensis TaxID=1005944 RepID=A0A1G9UZA6_9ACTN|nr:M15 family metallopeptidase [Nocardioides szechwanensis]SDM65117.1 D-alanyl-D-alanine carboxypeptidase [Nocardioides szechwanensis]